MDPTADLTPECVAELASRGPRYTSYPPATEFQSLTKRQVTRELEEVATGRRPASMYVHVPFCRSLCWYCACNVIPSKDAMRGERYVDTLATELAIVAGILGVDFPITELAIGGGSPNFLSPRSLRALMFAIRRCFALDPDARLSVELDPRDTTTTQIDTFAEAGFRALSVGVQDFASEVQDAIRRHQSRTQTRWLVDRAREAGFTDVNIDIVYGLPRQNEESFARTLASVLELAPDRVALFGYAHLPDRLPHQRLVERAGRVLDRYERATLLLAAIEQLTAAGYIHIGLDHFAKPGSGLARAAAEGRLGRTFQGYVEHRSDTVLGFGMSAISSTPNMYWQNHSDLHAWETAIEAAKLPVHRGVELDVDDRIRRSLIERLMCDGEVDLGPLASRYGIDPERYFARELLRLAAKPELATFDRSRKAIRATRVGKLLVRNVCAMFDRYHHEEARFSSTI